jgi:hypothetical protein
MDNEPLVRNWQAAIIRKCHEILGRGLTSAELAFIQSRGGFLALEQIEDHVQSLRESPEELERFLHSDMQQNKQWHVVVEFTVLAEADTQWKLWCSSHDVSNLASSDIRIDTGRGDSGRDVRRYSVLESAMAKVRALPSNSNAISK